MQRVLSLQMARGFGESSEFVTKRMCFSFLFSVGFLCLLCGFLLGRFAFEKSNELLAERRRLELAGNGLENTDYLRQLMLEKLRKVSHKEEEEEYTWKTWGDRENGTLEVVHAFSNLSFIHRITRNDSSIVAMSRGSREPDRYVILSASGEGIHIALELARIFNHLRFEYRWKSRRSLIFCVFLGPFDVCPNALSNFIKRRVVTYIALYGDNLRGDGKIVWSASDIVRSIVFQDIDRSIPGIDRQIFNHHDFSFPRLALNIPHVVFSIAKENNSTQHERKQSPNFDLYSTALAQLIGDAIWKLSESLVLRWNPGIFNDTIKRTLEIIKINTITKVKDNFEEVLEKLVLGMTILSENVDATESSKSLDIRILNDLLIDLDKVLLCSDEHHRSKTDLAQLYVSLQQSIDINELMKCYKMALQILQEQ